MKHRRAPYIWTLRSLITHCANGPKERQPDGAWTPARPLGLDSLGQRLRLAWWVFTGHADALLWSDKR